MKSTNFFNFFSKRKKAEANMWWIIIGMVMALVVLIIVLVFFTDRQATLNLELFNCESKGGDCLPEDTANSVCKSQNGKISTTFGCPQKSKCCIKIET